MNAPSRLPISVVLPCWRCAETIGRALDSVRAQTAQPVEIFLVDDASDDDTGNVLRELAAAFPSHVLVRVIELEVNGGPAKARNAGWEAASQEYVAFLDADDSWHPRKLEIQYSAMKRYPQIAASGHLHAVTADARWNVPAIGSPQVELIGFQDLLWRNRFITSSAMVKRNLKNRFLGCQRYMEDHRLWLDIACNGAPLLRIEAELAAHHKADFGASGLSSHLWRMEAGELSNYAALLNARRISKLKYAILLAWSIVKFTRRLAIVLGRSIRQELRRNSVAGKASD